MKKQDFSSRIKLVKAKLRKANADCLIVTKPANVTYLSGFSGEDSWIVLTERAVFFITDSRYTEQAESECAGCKIISRQGSMISCVSELLEKFKSIKIAAVEDSTSAAVYNLLKKKLGCRIKPVGNIVEGVRLCKDKGEITAVKKASAIAHEALKKVRRFIRPGISESQLAAKLDYEIHSLGAVNSFPTIVAFGKNASRPHHIPGSNKLKKDDSVLIDFGARYNCYCSDITRCFKVGKANKLYDKAVDTVKKAQLKAISLVKAGVKIAEVDSAARSVISNAALPVYGHGTGHGLGLEVHEGPVLSPLGKGELQEGMIITIEPGIYIPGKLGVRIEDDVLVTKKGCQILTGG